MGAFHAARDWGRLLTACVTPFSDDGTLDLSALRRVARYLVEEQKNDGLVVCGTTGESPTLTHEEKLTVLETVLDEIGDQAAVVMGAGTYNTAESQQTVREATERGAHGIMLVNPYYNKPGQEGLEAHFRACAAETDLPVMLYNIEPRSAINLTTDTLMRLAEEPNIVAVKEASGNLNQIADVCAQMPEGFRVYSGDDALTLPILSVGGHGLVSVAAHLVGAELAEMMAAFPTDPSKATKLSQQVLPTVRAVFSAPSPAPVKYALGKRGVCGSTTRLPIVPLNHAQQKVVDQVL